MSPIKKVKSSDPKSADYFGGKQKLAVAQLVTTPELITPHVVLTYSKFQDHGYRAPFPSHGFDAYPFRYSCMKYVVKVYSSTKLLYSVSQLVKSQGCTDLHLCG